MIKIERKTKKIIAIVITTTVALFGALWNTNLIKVQVAQAATEKKETVDIRIINTTDIHGQLNSMDYEQGVDYNIGGLARVYDLIQKARQEKPDNNTFTLDVGDVLYDYTTEYIFSESQNEIQPIYQAMAKIGYDAITLGNHDFDYGYEYILNQLDGSGLRDVAVVSNVVDSKTGEYPFLENMLITRKMETSTGKEIEIKVGIIGETIPTLTSKTENYTGILKTEDIVANVTWQAAKLKEMGADVIIALAHTGMGTEKPELNFKNVAYALTLIPEVDVVVCGHEHNLFPTTDKTSPYYKLPNVDKNTYLINGKNLVMAGDRGRAIGVVDLTLEVSKDKSVSIADRSTELRLVTDQSVEEDQSIASLNEKWKERLLEYSTDIIGKIDNGVAIQNFYGLLGDNTAIQLLNDTKISYALGFANTTGIAYKDYPIIAASVYASYGETSIDDFINMKDQITESELTKIQPYNNYLYVYSITGKQLREWLEWSASAYETTSQNVTWTDSTMSALMKDNKLKSLIKEEWMNDWSSFYIFDGIDYVINPYVGPRYDISGNRISSNTRIQSITYNGKEITDSTKLLLATNKITQPTDANRGIEKQVALNGFNRGQLILSKYMKQLSNSGNLLPQVDYNWKVDFEDTYQFIVKAPYYADSLLKGTKWYANSLEKKDQYNYYSASYPSVKEDTAAPHIVLAPTKTGATGSAYKVAVNVSDSSEMKVIRFMKGEYDISYSGWTAAKNITDHTFTVYENGTYSIYAEDIRGNKIVRKLVISNFSEDLLGTPTVQYYTNRKTKITGTAEPGTTIVFEADTGIYESKVGITGKYSYSLPAQRSGSEVIVYSKDYKTEKESERLTIKVNRTGPNQPSVSPINNNDGYISGSTYDTDASVIAIIGDKVYVSDKGGKTLYENAIEIYDPALKIVETSINIYDSRYYTITLPSQEAKAKVTIYNLDHLSRISRANSLIVSDVSPNAPVVYEVSNIERTLAGYIPTTKNMLYDVYLDINGTMYNAKSDKDGAYTFDFNEQLKAGQILEVYTTDVKNGATRESYHTKVIVNDIQDFVRLNSTYLTLKKVTNKSNYISGTYLEEGTIYLAICEGEGENFTNDLYIINTDSFSRIMFELSEKLSVGAKIYAMARYTDGNILLANMTEVLAGRPDTPSILEDVTNSAKSVQVIADKDCEVLLKIGTKTYTSSKYQYDKTKEQYLYSFITDRELSDTLISITATNLSGTSDVFSSKVIKAAPDSPQVKTVKAGAKKVTGKIELLDYEVINEDSKEGKIEDTTLFKDAQPMVAKTQTRIFALIGKKTYEGVLDNEGNFTIKILAQVEGTAIKVWGENKAGRGPLIKVVVVAAAIKQ